MARPYRLSEIEEEHGPLEPLFLRLLNELQTEQAVASHLNISTRTVSRFIKGRFEKKCRWVPTTETYRTIDAVSESDKIVLLESGDSGSFDSLTSAQ